MITFSSPNELAQREPSKSRVYPIDSIIFKFEGEIRRVPAKGVCRPTNPANPSSSLGCQADSAVGKFEGEFWAAPTKASGL